MSRPTQKPVVIQQQQTRPRLEAHSFIVFIGAFVNSFLLASMFAPALYAKDYTITVAAVIGFIIYVLSTAAAYTDIVIDLSIYVIGSISGLALGSTIGVSFAGYILKPMIDFGISLGRWLVSFAPYGTANILLYPLVMLAWSIVSMGLVATIDSIFLSVMANSLVYPYLAFSIGMVLYSVTAAFSLYMFAASAIYVAICAATANMLFWQWALQAIASDIMLLILVVFMIRFMPNILTQFVSGITSLFISPASFGYDYAEWFSNTKTALFIWLGVDLIGFIASTVLGLGRYYGYYVEGLRSLTVMGMMLFVMATMGTANWYAIAVAKRKVNPRRIMRIIALVQPALIWSAVAFMIGYGFSDYVVIEAFRDVVKRMISVILGVIPIPIGI